MQLNPYASTSNAYSAFLPRFIPQNGHRQYIHFIQDDGGCRSAVGMLQNGPNPLWLHNNCYDHGTTVHEIIHALGKQPGGI